MSDVVSRRVRRNEYGVLSPPALGAWRATRTVSVVIPAHQCQESLDLALAALSRQSYPPELFEVVVADDGSDPALVLGEAAPANCRMVRVPDHAAGWGRANALHVGAEVSDGEILHWLDADLVPFPDHVEAQARWHHLIPDAVTWGYKRFVRDGHWPTAAEVLRRCADGTIDELVHPDRADGHDYLEEMIEATGRLQDADHLAFRAHVGATAAVRRECYHAAGGMDRSLRLGEDSELGYRLAQAGAVFIPEPAARSWHLGPSHMMQVGQALRRYNRPFLADRMPQPRWLRRAPGRSWAVPLVVAVVEVGEAPLEVVRAGVDRLLASDEHDLRVVLVADWGGLDDDHRPVLTDPGLERRLIATTYRSEPRVVLAGAAPGTAFPSPYLLRVPLEAELDTGTVRRAVAELDARRLGLLRLDGMELWRTAALSRARRHARAGESLADVVAEVWGSGRGTHAVNREVRSRSPSAATVPRVSLIQAIRRQIRRRVRAGRRSLRLRTRLRRARQAWRRAFPRRLPAWSPPPDPEPHPPALVPATGPPAVDVATANPRGRHRYGHRLPHGRLRLATDGAGAVRWEVVRMPNPRVAEVGGKRDGTAVVAGRVGDPLDGRRSAVLAELGVLVADADSGSPPAAFAHMLAQLAMTGVIVHAPGLPAAVAERLAPELAELLRAPLPDRGADPLAWELRSVRQRRVAMRHHAAGLVPPLVSAVLVSKRPQLVVPAVAALAAQTYPELEIVVGTHGYRQSPPAPQVRMVPVPAERNLGEALAEATRAASGTLITKVDDDDRYGPEHIWDLVLARHYAGATVVGKGAELVYLEPKDLTVRRRMAAETETETVAGGTLTLTRADLVAFGGWPAVPRSVDRALLERVLGEGGTVYRTHPLGFVYTRHDNGHTWEADLDHFRVDAQRTWRGLPPNVELGGS